MRAQGDGKHRPYILTCPTFQLLIEPLATKIDTACTLCYHSLHITKRIDNMVHAWRVDPGSKIKLKDYDPNDTDKHTDRAAAEMELQQLSNELSELQELLSAAQL